MFSSRLGVAAVSILSLISVAVALQVPMCKSPGGVRSHARLGQNFLQSTGQDTEYGFRNLGDVAYTVDIVVGGQPFTAMIDTGSSDLWLDICTGETSAPRTLTGILPANVSGDSNITISYIDGTSATGPVVLSDVVWGGFTVANQAYISACNSNATDGSTSGLVGLSSSTLQESQIRGLFPEDDTSGDTLIDNVFDQYSAENQYITTLLSRTDAGASDGGIFTIGETASGYEHIIQSPELPVLLDDEWAIAIDGITINGAGTFANDISSSTDNVDGQSQRLVMLLDTGTTHTQLPSYLVDAIYKDLPGATLDSDTSTWWVPCNTGKVNVSFIIGNQTFPIHPIDTVILPITSASSPSASSLSSEVRLRRREHGAPWCQGTFQYTWDNVVSRYDGILGDVFLRNVYAQFNYGDWSRRGSGTPFIRLLNTTDEASAWAEYDTLNTKRLQDSLIATSGCISSRVPSSLLVSSMISLAIYSLSHGISFL